MVFMLPDTLICHSVYSRCVTRRGTQVVNDMFIASSQCSQLITRRDGGWFCSFYYFFFLPRSWSGLDGIKLLVTAAVFYHGYSKAHKWILRNKTYFFIYKYTSISFLFVPFSAFLTVTLNVAKKKKIWNHFALFVCPPFRIISSPLCCVPVLAWTRSMNRHTEALIARNSRW